MIFEKLDIKRRNREEIDCRNISRAWLINLYEINTNTVCKGASLQSYHLGQVNEFMWIFFFISLVRISLIDSDWLNKD